MKNTAVINVVGLTRNLLQKTTYLKEFANKRHVCDINTITPAVTCSVQSTYITGLPPSGHGIVANGWYFDELAQIWFWRQSNKLVQGEKIWETAKKKKSTFTCANMFWWYNMYSDADFSVTPRPMYPADGRKIPDIYAFPSKLRSELTEELGTFPLFHFWGPNADIRSSQWIADASCLVYKKHEPTLNLIYLPHLDYILQKLGPNDPGIDKEIIAIDNVCKQLIDFFTACNVELIFLSEYAVHQVDGAIHINRILREENWIHVREELGKEILDPGASEAFAVADHQIAHLYIKNKRNIAKIKKHLEKYPEIEIILDEEKKEQFGLSHYRSGDLVLLARENKWFSYYYWLDDNRAPDFARTVDIHRKPGYDPVELFIDPKIKLPLAKIAYKLIKKKIGFRYLLDIIPLDASLVRGSHGRTSSTAKPIFITSNSKSNTTIEATEIKNQILSHIDI